MSQCEFAERVAAQRLMLDALVIFDRWDPRTAALLAHAIEQSGMAAPEPLATEVAAA